MGKNNEFRLDCPRQLSREFSIIGSTRPAAMMREHQNWSRHIDPDPLHFSEAFGIKITGQQDRWATIQFNPNYR
ncbi:hypothetical protein GCM10010331_64590 [Streptomyces xanthochromogenes]|nr:hypothetical protein GCM10010331_64590 [Streptomyces xanthochromogenes]